MVEQQAWAEIMMTPSLSFCVRFRIFIAICSRVARRSMQSSPCLFIGLKKSWKKASEREKEWEHNENLEHHHHHWATVNRALARMWFWKLSRCMCAPRKWCSSLHLQPCSLAWKLILSTFWKGFNGNLFLTKLKKFCWESSEHWKCRATSPFNGRQKNVPSIIDLIVFFHEKLRETLFEKESTLNYCRLFPFFKNPPFLPWQIIQL